MRGEEPGMQVRRRNLPATASGPRRSRALVPAHRLPLRATVRRGRRPVCRRRVSVAARSPLCGCQSSSNQARQTRAESISPAKGDDTAVLASATTGQGSGVITTASDAAGSGSGSPAGGTNGGHESASSRWASFSATKIRPTSLVLPRNDQAAENGAVDGAPKDGGQRVLSSSSQWRPHDALATVCWRTGFRAH